jgi:glutamate-1-semialdehyde 2,1-aminomutase
MNEFLCRVVKPATAKLYEESNQRCAEWVRSTNEKLAESSLPLRVVNLATVWTVLFKDPSRYNWLLQYYLRAEGVTLSWVGTGRCLSSMDFTVEDYNDWQAKLLNATHKMKSDGWWLTMEEYPGRERTMRARLLREMFGSLVQMPKPLKGFYMEVMQRKEDDHHASHSNGVNQFFHLLSSSVFIYCYILAFSNLITAMCLGLAALFVRQFGHAILEPPCHDKEKIASGLQHAQQDAHRSRIFLDTRYTAVTNQRLDCIGSDFNDRPDRSTVVSLDHGRGLRASGVSHVEA